MDYEKAYKEAIKRAKKLYEQGTITESLNYVFPELKESEDEKIRKELIDFLDGVWHFGKNANFDKYEKADCANWISWLEKQGEQKPIDIDYGNAFDEFISHIPEKDPDSCNSLYTYGDIEDAIKFGIKWYKQQKRHVSYDIIEQTFNKSKTYEFPENADAVTYSESILPSSVYKGENDDEYKMHKIIEAAYIEGKKQNQKNIEWTEEDSLMKDKTINYINTARMYVDVERMSDRWADECINWLKSLKEIIKK